MKKFTSIILILCLFLTGFVFVGCNSSQIVLNGGPAYTDKIYGNGGFIVTKGDYVYFTDSYIKSSSLGSSITNELGTVIETGLYRAKMSTELISDVETPVLTEVELMVSKTVGFENSGLYIFKDKIYFASPTIDKDSSGIRYDLITFFSCNLDGSNLQKFYQLEEFSNGKFSMTMINKNVFLLIYDGNNLKVIDETGREKHHESDVTGAVLPERTTVFDENENPTSSDCFVYYTVDKENKGSIKMGNILYKMDIETGNKIELLNEDRSSVVLNCLKDGRLFYTRNELFAEGTISDNIICSNTLDKEIFLEGETKHFDEDTIDYISLGVYEGNNLGFAYLSAKDKIIIKSINGDSGKELVSSATKIICSRNGYLYYVATSNIYRISLTEEDASAEKISGSLTIKTDYFDIDEDFFYFFAEDTSKTNKISCYRVDLNSSNKVPVKMA